MQKSSALRSQFPAPISTALGCLLVGALLSPALAAGDEAGASHRAFEHLKKERAAIAAAYSDELFKLAEQCVEFGGGKIGPEILERIVALHTPPRSRRKTAQDSGVMAGAEKEAAGAGGSEPEGEGEDDTLSAGLPRAAQQPSEAEQELAELRTRTEAIKARYQGAGSGFDERALKRLEDQRERATAKFVEQ